MSIYARLQAIGGVETVVELIGPMSDSDGNEIPINERYHPAFVATLIDVTAIAPQPQELWTTADGGKTFAAPAAV